MKNPSFVRAACLQATFAVLCAATFSTAQAQTGLDASPSEIPEIIVTASKSEQDLQTTPVGATIITRAQIESAGVMDANEAIRKIGGVVARADLYGGREYSLDLRGFGVTANENTVVLVDGIRISENEQGMAARLTGIAASFIDRIEILRGGAGVMWGEGATAGVINIITRQGAKAGLAGQVGIGLESYDGKEATANLRIGMQDGKGAFDLNARSYFANGYRDNNKSSQDVFSLGYAYREGALNFRSRLNHEVSNVGLPGPLTEAQIQANPRQTTKPHDWYSYATTKLNMGVDYQLQDWKLVLDGGIKNRSSGYQYVSQGAKVPTTNSVQTAQLSPRVVYKGGTGAFALTATVGLDMHVWRYNSDGAYDVSWTKTTRTGQQSNRALFAMTDWLFPSQTRLVAGYRLENVVKSSQDATTAPLVTSISHQMHAGELSINQTVQKGVDVYARYATSYRMANIDDYNAWYNHAQPLPQTSTDKELGVKWRTGGTTASVRYFVQNTNNEIAQDPSGSYNWNFSDPTKRSGIELQALSALSPAVTLSGSVQAMKALFESGVYAGNQVPLVSNNTASVRASYKIDAQQSLESAVRWMSAQYLGYDYANACGKQIPNSKMLDAMYRYKEKSYELSIGVNNMTNRLTYSAMTNCGDYPYTIYYPDPGRTLRIALKYNF